MKKRSFPGREIAPNCASAMFVADGIARRKNVVRFCAELDELVNTADLQRALDRAVDKMPYIFAEFTLRGNSFTVKPTDRRPLLSPYSGQMTAFGPFGECQARLACNEKTVIFEFSHAIADAMGGFRFLSRLLAEYFSLRYADESISESIPAIPLSQQTEDGYKKYAKGAAFIGNKGNIFRIRGTPEPYPNVHINTYRFPVKEIKTCASEYDATVGEFTAALLFAAMTSIQKETGSNEKAKKIRLGIPVDLRRRFPSQTSGNFSFVVYPEFDPRSEMDMQSLCAHIRRYMRTATDLKRLAGRCNLIAKAERLSRHLSFATQRRIVNANLDAPSAGGSMTFSNLGVLSFSDRIDRHIKNLTLSFSAKPNSPYSCSLLTFGETTSMTLLRQIKEPVLEEEIEQIFHFLGVHYQKEQPI